jgi:hypothetical protein
VSHTSYGSQAASSIGTFVNEITVGTFREPDRDSTGDAFRAMAFTRHG